MNLNDQVEAVHRILVNDVEQYRALLRAVFDEQAIEGSLVMDDALAVIMIREKALKIGYSELATEKLATIRRSLRVVLRRYGASREERRKRISADFVVTPQGEVHEQT